MREVMFTVALLSSTSVFANDCDRLLTGECAPQDHTQNKSKEPVWPKAPSDHCPTNPSIPKYESKDGHLLITEQCINSAPLYEQAYLYHLNIAGMKKDHIYDDCIEENEKSEKLCTALANLAFQIDMDEFEIKELQSATRR